jgi:hypothetical protein
VDGATGSQPGVRETPLDIRLLGADALGTDALGADALGADA